MIGRLKALKRSVLAGAVFLTVAARTLVDTTHDPEVTRWFAGYLRRTGREDEADRLDPPRSQSRALKATAPTRAALVASSQRPVVFLHGYNGSAETWVDFVRVFGSAGYAKDDMLVFDYGADFAADEDTPIELLAANVMSKVRAWLRWRAGLAEGDTSHDADLPVPDWICHSMGGLVFRVVLKNAPGLVHRCVTLGTPHFGQAIGDYKIVADWTGDQTRQMSHGSTFLWDLAADWHYHGHRTDDILFIVGADASRGGEADERGSCCRRFGPGPHARGVELLAGGDGIGDERRGPEGLRDGSVRHGCERLSRGAFGPAGARSVRPRRAGAL